MQKPVEGFRDLANEEFDTRTLLRNAAEQAVQRHYEDFLIVDVDSHHYETEAFKEIAEYIQDPVLRHEAKFQGASRGGITSESGSYQEIGGRITRYPLRKTENVPPAPHRDITLMERWMDSIGVDMAIMFPTPMLNLSNCPRIQVEVALAQAYNAWLCDNILDKDPRIKSMLYLPFHDPDATYKIINEFADRKGVIGFMVTSTHYRANYDNAYMKSYAMLQERNLPLGFHAAFTWTDQSLQLCNRFIGVHALGFTWCNMLHMTNWITNGMPERFPKLKVLWLESGVAWATYLMQRLDAMYMARISEAPLLKEKPSHYMKRMFYCSQPLERPEDPATLEAAFRAINAETQLVWGSNFPSHDFDVPSTVYDLPFLDAKAKAAILGGNAMKLLGIDPAKS